MAFWDWSPLVDMEAMRREMERMFRESPRWPMPVFRAAFLPGRSARQYPMINLSEDKESFYVEALAPGVDAGSLDVTVAHNTLTISGEKPPTGANAKAEAFHRNERAAGRFVRTIDLPSEVDDKAVKANYRNGLLLITLPKSERAKPRQIAVQVG